MKKTILYKTKTRKRKTKKSTYSKKRNVTVKYGGKVIASGGYGCIFKPSLKCKTTQRIPGNISKLMTVKHAKDEYMNIEKFKSILSQIPNYDKYFLVDGFTICEPDELTKEDLEKYKCKPLEKKNITSETINNSLDQVLSINMPDGGVDIEDYLLNHMVGTELIKLNDSLLDLFIHGILPMNANNVYHCDIKDRNILVKQQGLVKQPLLVKHTPNTSTITTKLIDWGLSVYVNNKDAIPKKLYRRPFQFNTPFSCILFNTEFVKRYSSFLKQNPIPSYFMIREFVINYLFIWIKIRGPGHLKVIHAIMKKMFYKDLPALDTEMKNHFVEYDFTYYYIIEYLSKILEKYTKVGHFYLMDYFHNVFLKNNDIWGFVMVYFAIYEELYNKEEQLNISQLLVLQKIKHIIIHFLYQTPTEIIDTTLLVEELSELNVLFSSFHTNHKILPKIDSIYRISKSS
jgi:serine/threonine protein kinase